MTSTIIDIITRLEDHGYIILAYHHGRFRVAGILGWRDLEWAYRVLGRAA